MKSFNVRNTEENFLNRMHIEGRPLFISGWSGNLPAGGSRTILSNEVSPSGGLGTTAIAGKAYYIESLLITCDRPTIFGVQIKRSYWDTNGITFYFSVTNTTSLVVNHRLNLLIREGGAIAVYTQKNDAGEAPEVSSCLTGYEITNDLNYSAQKTMLVCGDSTTWSSLGNDNSGNPFRGKDFASFQLRDYISEQKASCRIINKGFGGSYGPDWEKAIDSGELDGINYDLLYVSLGLNDAGALTAGYTLNNFKDKLKLFVKHRDRYRKGKPVLFLAPTHTDKTNLVANIASIRTAVQETVNECGGTNNNVLFVNQANAFSLASDPTTDFNFTNGERTAGNRLHPSGYGNKLIADYIISSVGTQILEKI